eukprot:6801345-Pyramimonas_sp.AAC.2
MGGLGAIGTPLLSGSRDGPIRRWTCGYILMTDQSDAGTFHDTRRVIVVAAIGPCYRRLCIT